jgi:hypothetical protein
MERKIPRNIQSFKKKGFQPSKFIGRKNVAPPMRFGRKNPQGK